MSDYIHYSCTKQRYHSDESLPLIIVDSPLCQAVISLYGGQVLEFIPHNKTPLLWLSPKASFTTGKAIRGGIPICAPWFGHHPQHTLNHGFARISLWEETNIVQRDNGELTVQLTLKDNEHSKTYGYQHFTMRLDIHLGKTLTLDFMFENQHEKTQVCEWAFHSYLMTNDCHSAQVTGLENLVFNDKTNKNISKRSSSPVLFNQEVDCFYNKGSIQQQLITEHSINIAGNNCDSVIIWNPGAQLAEKMTDIKGYQHFVCVERGAINNNSWHQPSLTMQQGRMTLSYID